MKSNVTVSPIVRVLRVGLLTGLLAGLSGCAHQVYNVQVEAIQNPEISTGYSYRLVDREQARAELDPHHETAMHTVRAALATRGMYEAPDPGRAEVEVIVDYGVGPQKLKVETRIPGWAPSAERAPFALVPVRRADGSAGYAVIPATQLDFDGTYHGVRVLRGVQVCEKYLSISARETAAAAGARRKPTEAWLVEARVEDASDSLEGYLPILAGAAADYLGTSTDGREQLKLREDSAVVAQVSGR